MLAIMRIAVAAAGAITELDAVKVAMIKEIAAAGIPGDAA